MKESILTLITTSGKRKELISRILSSILTQTIKPHKIYLIYDGIWNLNENLLKNFDLPIGLFDNPKKLLLTCLQNKIIHKAKEDFILLLNDDVILNDNFIEELMLVMNEDTQVGIACGKILRMDRKTIDSAGQFLAKDRRPLERGYGMFDRGQFNKPEDVFGACGAAVLYRKKMLDEIAITNGEYLDNDYHMFYEDLDLSWRAQNFGWKVFYNPKAIAYHERGATAKSKKPKFIFFQSYNFAWLNADLKADLLKNRYLTIVKNDKLKKFIFNLPQILFYEIKLWLFCLLFDPKAVLNFIRKGNFVLGAFKKRRLIFKRIKSG